VQFVAKVLGVFFAKFVAKRFGVSLRRIRAIRGKKILRVIRGKGKNDKRILAQQARRLVVGWLDGWIVEWSRGRVVARSGSNVHKVGAG
jgi:hypothetical protein